MSREIKREAADDGLSEAGELHGSNKSNGEVSAEEDTRRRTKHLGCPETDIVCLVAKVISTRLIGFFFLE